MDAKKLPFLLCAGATALFLASCGKTAEEKVGPKNSMYTLDDIVWEDDFSGKSLDMNDWNYEYHEPGWVNNELQEYVDAKENVYVKNGTLVIQAVKKQGAGGVAYTSGRVNTRGKHDFTYGRFEARLMVPDGKGFLPAFWMMPTDENLYGQWPKCGEIDIMEVLGSRTDTQYGTLHFGEPHSQKQGVYTKFGSDFSAEFHVYAVEWDPGEMRFYVDDTLFFRTSEWFTKKQGFGEVTYPAPYDQPFYMILNVAVGGDWPGYPDPDAEFGDNARMVVDYVRVYQKPSYDENVSKPEEPQVTVREPDASGNYVTNGSFAESEPLDDGRGWGFLLAGSGKGSAQIYGDMLHITSETPGDLDYSIQVVQPNIPLEKGSSYHYQFDAYADDERTVITAITAPNNGWIRYLTDTKVQVGKTRRTYEFDFVMKDATDPTARVEFNLGNQDATAGVHITGVRLEKTGTAELAEEVRMLPDGNYVYNGEFQEGADRLAFWDVSAGSGAEVSVTNVRNVRELKAVSPASAGADAVTVSQDVDIQGGKTYRLSFDAYADSPRTVALTVGGVSLEAPVGTERETHTFVFDAEGDGPAGRTLSFSLGGGTVYLDAVRLQDDGMIINGDFSGGLTGWEVYAHGEAQVDYAVDSLSEADAFCMNISDTGSQDWMIQLKQSNITLEQGKTYRVAFDAKSTRNRSIMYALQRDGTNDDNWMPYSGTQFGSATGSFAHYETVFTMTEPTDTATILSISMGAVEGTQIRGRHTVTIDNVVVEEVQ